MHKVTDTSATYVANTSPQQIEEYFVHKLKKFITDVLVLK